MVITALKMAGFAASGVASAIKEANEVTDSMIDNLKNNENLTVNRIGRVLEGTKFGFLMGYVSPSILTAVGVCLTTGDLVLAASGGIAVLGNPIAGTCAAVGAVFFGWSALNDTEREEVLNQVGKFLNVGWEQIKAVVNFAIKTMKELLSADNIQEMKETVAQAATAVGRHISDITKSVRDKFGKVVESVENTVTAAVNAITDATASASETTVAMASGITKGASKVNLAVKDAVRRDKEAVEASNEQ